ncbi:MAG: trigger factor [Deltaproteobacteria bacterium]|nr:trigger factor [Deltaproteobacteria bacterium]
MQCEVKEISPTEVELAIEVPWDSVHADMEKRYKQLAATAKIRGFRPGKAPRQVVRQVYGKSVEAEVTAQLVEHACMTAIAEHKLPVVAAPSLGTPKLTKGEHLCFTATLEVQPKLETIVVEGLNAKRPVVDIADSLIDEEIRQLQRQNATVSEPDPMRPAREGDLLLIDYAVSIDGEPRKDMDAEGRPVELGDGHLLSEVEQALIGAVPGDECSAEVTFPEDHGSEDLRGKTALFTVQVKELKEQLLPELDDDFAKDCGDFETLAELRKSIREQAETRETRRSESILKERIIDALLEAHEVPVPPTMLAEQRQRMMYEAVQFAQMMGQQGHSMPSGMFDGIDQRAERRVQAALLLGAFSRQEGLEVTDEELDARYAEIAERTGKHIAKVRAEHTGEHAGDVESELIEEKIWAILHSRVNIEDETSDDEAAGGNSSDEASDEQGEPE